MLMPGSEADEKELLEWTSARVDEPPARPKSVSIIPSMPMTNVGKIFKPELRRMAVENTVVEILETVNMDDASVEAVLSQAGKITVAVTCGSKTDNEQRASLVARLEPLPVKMTVS